MPIDFISKELWNVGEESFFKGKMMINFIIDGLVGKLICKPQLLAVDKYLYFHAG